MNSIQTDIGNTEFVYEGLDGKIVIPRDQQSFSHWSKGTKWAEHQKIFFEQISSIGPLYIFIVVEEDKISKYKIHFNLENHLIMFKDSNDKMIFSFENKKIYEKQIYEQNLKHYNSFIDVHKIIPFIKEFSYDLKKYLTIRDKMLFFKNNMFSALFFDDIKPEIENFLLNEYLLRGKKTYLNMISFYNFSYNFMSKIGYGGPYNNEKRKDFFEQEIYEYLNNNNYLALEWMPFFVLNEKIIEFFLRKNIFLAEHIHDFLITEKHIDIIKNNHYFHNKISNLSLDLQKRIYDKYPELLKFIKYDIISNDEINILSIDLIPDKYKTDEYWEYLKNNINNENIHLVVLEDDLMDKKDVIAKIIQKFPDYEYLFEEYIEKPEKEDYFMNNAIHKIINIIPENIDFELLCNKIINYNVVYIKPQKMSDELKIVIDNIIKIIEDNNIKDVEKLVDLLRIKR